MIKTFITHKLLETCINVFFDNTLNNFSVPKHVDIGKRFSKIVTQEFKYGMCVRTVMYGVTLMDRGIATNGTMVLRFSAELAYVQMIKPDGTTDDTYLTDLEKLVSPEMLITFDIED